jgi:D-glycero-alpha-D-manno-heptose-7-phosphate kinase
MDSQSNPHTIVNAVAPIRICDNGGWTDTWFAGTGRIFNIGVYPFAEVQVAVSDAKNVENRIVINAENFGERYTIDPAIYSSNKGWNRHPLLEAAIEYMQISEDLSFEVTIYSEAPAGASTGTSAAVTVALIGGLDSLTPGRMALHEVALAAQRVETVLLNQQCGIQDQLCSVYGGINYIEMTQYPHATVSPIQIANSIWWELERRLVLIYLGKTHSSSDVHEMVINSLENGGPDCPQLVDLRETAPRSRDALYAGDFEALGKAMIDNTDAQSRLHPNLIPTDAHKVIEIARAHGALGWKVNGAGGEGGSLTILCGPRSDKKRAMIRAIEGESERFKHILTYLSRYGLRVWKHIIGNEEPRSKQRSIFD